ncbi:MAG: hypothetical protein AAB554_03595 [Patescibacteria group bacterium]
MDQSAPKQAFTKPIGGFVVVLCVALFVGGWLYVDMVKNELEMKVDSVAADLQAVRAARKAAEEKETPSPAAPKTITYAAGLGDYRFQVDLPEGHHLEFDEDGLTARVVSDQGVETDHRYDISISLVDPHKEPYASYKPELGLRVIRTDDGKASFWITGWEGFVAVAASFKAL